MTKTEFQTGLKVFFSCGGANSDKQTLEVWYRMLADIHPKDFERAVLGLCSEVKELGRANFVAEVKDRSRLHRRQRESALAREARMLPPSDVIPVEDLQALIKDFNEKFEERVSR